MSLWQAIKSMFKKPQRTDEERERLVNEVMERRAQISEKERQDDIIDKVLDCWAMDQETKDRHIEILVKGQGMRNNFKKSMEKK